MFENTSFCVHFREMLEWSNGGLENHCTQGTSSNPLSHVS